VQTCKILHNSAVPSQNATGIWRRKWVGLGFFCSIENLATRATRATRTRCVLNISRTIECISRGTRMRSQVQLSSVVSRGYPPKRSARNAQLPWKNWDASNKMPILSHNDKWAVAVHWAAPPYQAVKWREFPRTHVHARSCVLSLQCKRILRAWVQSVLFTTLQLRVEIQIFQRRVSMRECCLCRWNPNRQKQGKTMQFKCNSIRVGATFVQKTFKMQCGFISNELEHAGWIKPKRNKI
jgi:hypothetical protein